MAPTGSSRRTARSRIEAEGLVKAAERLKSKPLAASGRLAEDKKAQRKKDVSAYRSALAYMCWLYADQKFVVPEGSPWASFFDWMKNRPAQFAHA